MSNKFNKLKGLTSTLATVISLTAFVPMSVNAREMRVSSFEPAQGFYSSKILSVWIDQVNEKLSDGNSFRLYPGGILGAPPAQQELVKKGVADVALVVTTYSPGLFPLSSVVEVPSIAPTSADGTNVLMSLLESGDLQGEYDDYKVVALFTTHGYRFFTNDKQVRVPSDLEGMKLRTPSPYTSKLVSMLGASGVSIPAPQVYENLDRGVVDGAIWVFDAFKTFRLNEVAPHIAMTQLSATPMAILMNKSAYEALPDVDKKVIDEMSGRSTSEWVASVIDEYDFEQQKQFRQDYEVEFNDLTEAEQAKWDDVLSGALPAWLEAQKKFGVDGTSVLDKAIDIRTNK